MKARLIGESPYEQLICSYFSKQFPHVSKPSKTELVDIISDILVGDKNLRHGAIPSPEILVNIRTVVRDAIEKRLPIPVLAPWGGRKTDPAEPIDIAEVSGLQQIVLTDKMVKEFFEPGLQVNMRIEDINAMWLYRADAGLGQAVCNYSRTMENLVYILRGAANITPMPESKMMDQSDYFATAVKYSQLLYPAILKLEAGSDSDFVSELRELKTMGWKGTIDKPQRDYYLGRYKHLYGVSDDRAAQLLADYFAGSKARYDLNAKGVPKSGVKGFIQANFAHPVPFAPAGLFDSTVYWRTVPTSQGRTHIAPWRGKGFLKINRNEITTKVTSWTDEKIKDMVKQEVRLEDGGLSAVVRTDYIIES